MTEALPKIEPLINDLKNLDLGNYLKSTDYKRYLIKAGLEESWRNAFNHVKNNRRYFSVDLDHEYFDSIDTMVLLLNHFYSNNQNAFFLYLHDLLMTYTEWSKKDLFVKNIVEDLELLTVPHDILQKIEYLGNYFSNAVPKSEIPQNISNAEKLDSMIRKMESSIQNHEYNLTITYAYSCLEGLFKAYINELIPEKLETDKLNQLAKIVRDDIVEKFNKNGVDYPEQMINLVTTMTNAISNARNRFSDSHFENESDKWLAEFVKDCVNSIGRLILKLTKNTL